MNIQNLLELMVAQRASDLHLANQLPPRIRIDNELTVIPQAPVLTEELLQAFLIEIMPESLRESLEQRLEINFSFESLQLSARFRVNAFQQMRGLSIAIRYIPLIPPSLADLDMPNPQVLNDLCNLSHGLVLVTGPTGSGKSSTLAAMINYINDTFNKHIITIEDPIEFVHTSRKALIQQREVSRHTKSFEQALRAALRADPDYLLIGELLDLESIRLALTAAETGHLVLATLHTNSAPASINRMVDVFPSAEKELVRLMLANSLRAVVSQRLLKKIGGGRVVAQEIMLCTAGIRNLIKENRVQQIYSAIQTGKALGMQTLASNVQEMIERRVVDEVEHKQLAELT